LLGADRRFKHSGRNRTARITLLQVLIAVLILFASAILIIFINKPVAAQEGFFERSRLTDDWGGLRKQLEDAGITPVITDVSETLSNPTGGIGQLSIYQGLLEASLTLDLEKLLKWPGATFYTDGYWISGQGLSENAIGNLLFVSSIEALASTRLHDLWLQQEFLDHRASLRIGQIAFDDEFYISQYSAGFVNSSFGCPDTLSNDLPSGGPCYPFATPGARLRVAPTSDLTLSAAFFNGNPAPSGPGNPQVRNSSGTNFLIGEGGFMPIAELAYSFDEQPISSTNLSDVKLGAWYHTGEFPDQRRDSSGLSLASPGTNGIPAMHGGNFGAYTIVDKMLWRRPDTATEGFAAFFRLGYAPPDRNLFSLEIDAGLTFKGLVPTRELDVLGVGTVYGRIGYARRLDRDQVLFTGIERPIRDYESALEITYEARIAPWWLLQPDLQLIFHPGGYIRAPPPAPIGQAIPNALVIGVRSGITF
jgi:porin